MDMKGYNRCRPGTAVAVEVMCRRRCRNPRKENEGSFASSELHRPPPGEKGPGATT